MNTYLCTHCSSQFEDVSISITNQPTLCPECEPLPYYSDDEDDEFGLWGDDTVWYDDALGE